MRVFTAILFLFLIGSVVAQQGMPVASFSVSEKSICANSCISVADRSTGAISKWQWSFEGGIPATSESKVPGNICYKTPGIYQIILTVTSDKGDISSESIEISVGTISQALITVEPAQGVAPLNVQISTTAPAGQCTWYVDGMTFTDMSALSHIFQNAGNFDICLVTKNNLGCKDSACADVLVWDPSPQDSSFLVVPNVFTPNNDLQNDIFRSTSMNVVEWDSRIYNRWGQMVYNSAAPDIMWDGMWNGRPCDDGVYIYTIKAVGGDGKIYDISGTLTLFR